MADLSSVLSASGSAAAAERDEYVSDCIATEVAGSGPRGSHASNDDGWETVSSDGSIPDPDEIIRMANKGPLFDWERVSKVVHGSKCWKCDLWSTYFCCESCGRTFHRECVFMDAGYPDPIFDKSMDDAYMANYNEVKLLKCSICRISEETQVQTFHNLSLQQLNEILFFIARYIHAEFGIDILPKIELNGITTTDIQEKASRGDYKSIEGFYNDYKMIQHNIIVKFAVESEENDVAKTVLNTVELYLHVLLSCVDCVKKYFTPEGRPYSAKEFSRVIRVPCTEPHVILWIKEEGFPFWPAKMLARDPVKKNVVFQFFGERAIAKKYPFPSEDVVFQTYSTVFPDRKSKKSESKWSQACAECNGYLKSLRERFGEGGVIVSQISVKFDGDLDAYKRAMFPLYTFGNEQTGGVPNPDPNPENV